MSIEFNGNKLNANCGVSACSQGSHITGDAISRDATAACISGPSSPVVAVRFVDAGLTQPRHGHRQNTPRYNWSISEILCGSCAALLTFSAVFSGALFFMGWVPPVSIGSGAATSSIMEPHTLAPST
ncbi:hypothetical protein MRX96_002085 [Rhipicephalus microplus]